MISCGVGKQEVIGVTGFIGSGKSVVSRLLAIKLACPHLDADKIAGSLMEPEQEGWLAIQDFNPKYIKEDGQLDRVLLRHDIFSEPTIKEAIDSRIHPLVQQRLAEILEKRRVARIVVEVPLLFEAGWEDFFDRVILVYAEKDVCLRRVDMRDGVGLEQAAKSYDCQMGAMEKIERADHVIDNSGSWWSTQLQLLHLVEILRR